jgi:hypothetical protein
LPLAVPSGSIMSDPMMRGTHMALTKKADDIIAEVQKRI